MTNEERKPLLRVLNLGAGIQSTTLYLWAVDGQIQFDVAIFADTGDEPQAVYRHVEFLKTLGGTPIIEVRACENSLGDNLKIGMKATGQMSDRHVSIPTFLDDGSGSPALGRRQCTSEYKIRPIERKIRELIGLNPGEQCREQRAEQIMGLSFDEPKRVAGVKGRFEGIRWSKPTFPLFDEFMTRADCVAYLEKRLPGYVVPLPCCSTMSKPSILSRSLHTVARMAQRLKIRIIHKQIPITTMRRNMVAMSRLSGRLLARLAYPRITTQHAGTHSTPHRHGVPSSVVCLA